MRFAVHRNLKGHYGSRADLSSAFVWPRCSGAWSSFSFVRSGRGFALYLVAALTAAAVPEPGSSKDRIFATSVDGELDT
jgi:hypothetical protein